MLNILNKNETVKQAIEHDPNAVEVTRLVKSRYSEEEIAKRRFGVSYRVGCASELFPVMNNKAIWANHWEIRQWKTDYDKGEQTSQRPGNSNFRQRAHHDQQTSN